MAAARIGAIRYARPNVIGHGPERNGAVNTAVPAASPLRALAALRAAPAAPFYVQHLHIEDRPFSSHFLC